MCTTLRVDVDVHYIALDCTIITDAYYNIFVGELISSFMITKGGGSLGRPMGKTQHKGVMVIAKNFFYSVSQKVCRIELAFMQHIIRLKWVNV